MTDDITTFSQDAPGQDAAWAGDASDWYGEEQATFGDRLAGAREAAGMSQKALASRIGVRLAVIKKWEEDRSEPRANRLQMLSGILGVSLTWLITGRGEGPDLPEEGQEISADVAAALADIRSIRSQMAASAERLARVEKALRAQLGG